MHADDCADAYGDTELVTTIRSFSLCGMSVFACRDGGDHPLENILLSVGAIKLLKAWAHHLEDRSVRIVGAIKLLRAWAHHLQDRSPRIVGTIWLLKAWTHHRPDRSSILVGVM